LDLILLDLFCGTGGWSVGFHRAGFQCFGVDNIDVGYPYDLILTDIRDFTTDSWKYKGDEAVPTALTISPPCTEFSKITMLSYKKGQRGPPDPEKGMILVREAKRIVDELKPRYWILENVMGARKYIDPLLGKPKLVANPWVLWGQFPQVMFEQEPQKTSKAFHHGPWNWSEGKGFSAGKDPVTKKWVIGKGGTRRGLPEDFPFDPLRSWKRARIPVWLGLSIATAISREIGSSSVKA
jgi:hypothetical protein